MGTYNSNNYDEQGGGRFVVGGSLDVISGGEIDIESGGSFKVAGVDVAAQLASIANLADELAAINGLTASVAELNIMDGVTATKDEINAAADGIKGFAVGHTTVGHRIAVGTVATEADGSTNVDLSAQLIGIEAAVVCLSGAPTASCAIATVGAIAGTTLTITTYKSDFTTAADGAGNVFYIAFGGGAA